jgi:trans-aconitate 2-methyltransferase
MVDWNPSKYLKFKGERSKPSTDLIAHLEGFEPSKIVDLGCGPGNSTQLLRESFPEAQILGVDASPAMVEKAVASGVKARFLQADVTTWEVPADVDLLFSNALFHWVNDHEIHIARLFGSLKPGAVLAIQMPDNQNEPSHRLMRDLALKQEWRKKLESAGAARSTLLPPDGYYDLLNPFAKNLDIWKTTYFHRLPGYQSIVELLSTTALKPYLDALSAVERTRLMQEYLAGLKSHYRENADQSVLYPFPRLFIVATRADT